MYFPSVFKLLKDLVTYKGINILYEENKNTFGYTKIFVRRTDSIVQ